MIREGRKSVETKEENKRVREGERDGRGRERERRVKRGGKVVGQ